MGFYTKYFSTLLKGVRATSWKERIEARRAIRKFKRGGKEVKRTIQLIEEHGVTKSEKETIKALDALSRSAEEAYKFIFNVITQDKALVKAEQSILQALLELSQVTPKGDTTLRKLERDLALAILDGTKNYKYAERGERQEYQQVMLIVNEAKADKNKFMANIRLMFKDEDTVSLLSRFPMARGATREKIDILDLQRIANYIRALKVRFRPKLEKEAEHELMKDTQKVVADLKDAFYNSYTIKKRDTMLVLRILYYVHYLKEMLRNYIEKHYLPKVQTEQAIERIEKIENAIVQDFQTVAQGFRIVIAAIEKLDKEAERDIAELARAS